MLELYIIYDKKAREEYFFINFLQIIEKNYCIWYILKKKRRKQ